MRLPHRRCPATRQYALVLLCLFLFAPPRYGGLRITESTAQSLSFEWTLDRPSIVVSADAAGNASTVISFADANCDVGDRGDPALSGYAFIVGLPPSGEARVTISPLAVDHQSLAAPLAQWNDRRHDGGSPLPVFTDTWISQPIYGMMRGLRTARIVIRPIVYDPQSRTLRLLSRASGSVVFPAAPVAAAAPSSQGPGAQMMRRMIVNYDIAASWTARRSAALQKATAAAFPLSQGKALSFTIGDGHEGINEGTVNENGVIALRGGDIMALGASVPIGSVALYGSHKGEMPEKMAADLARIPDGITAIPLIRIDRGRIGYVDEADTFLAYVTGSSDWEFDSGATPRTWKFRLNRFEDVRHYWITARGFAADMDTLRQPSAGSGDTLTACMSLRLYKHPTALPASWDGGLERMWKTLSVSSPVFDYPLGLANPDSSATGLIRYTGYGPPASAGPTAEIHLLFANGTPIATPSNPNSWYSVRGLGSHTAVRFQAVGPANASYELASFEIRYVQKLDMRGIDRLTIYSPDTGRVVAYRVKNIPADGIWVIRIPLNESHASLIQPHIQGTIASWSDTAGRGVRYYLCSKSSVRAVTNMQQITVPSNTGYRISQLRLAANRANYLIVTENTFMEAAQRLAAHKERHASFDHPTPRIVEIHDVYREFSGGNIDPAGLRNFLAWANAYWAQPLEYVVFLGNGHWDYKHTQTTEPLFIPTFQAERDQGQKCVEDYFACLDASESWMGNPDIALGRIPCNTLAEAEDILNKIIDTEDPARADFGPWRNRVLLVADDDYQGSTPDGIRDHHNSSEIAAAAILGQTASVDIRKVYLFEYPWDALWEKPEATRAMAAEINNGASVVNWFGHGSDVVWSDEHILGIDNINIMHNKPRYPLFSSFSCSVAKFDKPGHNSLSDALIKYADGGALACIAATRLAMAASNTTLAQAFFHALFKADSVTSLGFAYRQAMEINSSSKQYVLLGDPSICYVPAVRRIKVTVTDRDGRELDTIQALAQVTVVCSVQTVAAAPRFDAQFGGLIQVSIFNPPDTSYRKDGKSIAITPYTLPGTPLFVGASDLRLGVHRQTVLMPRNLLFDKPGAKVLAYAWDGGRIAAGVCDNLVFHGTDTNAAFIHDTIGPRISIRPIYADPSRNARASFGDRVSVALPVSIGIDVRDESGLDVSSVTPDEGLTVEIPGVWGRRNINTKFRFSEGDFRSGEAAIALEENELAPGTYAFTISAQDLLGNIAKRSFSLEVVGKEKFSLKQVFNYPNPFRMGQGTRFFFYATAPTYPFDDDGVRVLIKIYTLSGKLVRVLDSRESGIANGIAWDGADQAGGPLTPNVYLWRAFATHLFTGATTRSAIQKLVIHPPR